MFLVFKSATIKVQQYGLNDVHLDQKEQLK